MCAHLPQSLPTLLHALWPFPPPPTTLNFMSATQPIFCPIVFLGFQAFCFRFLWVSKRRETCNRCTPIPFVPQHFISFLTSFPFFLCWQFSRKNFFCHFLASFRRRLRKGTIFTAPSLPSCFPTCPYTPQPSCMLHGPCPLP